MRSILTTTTSKLVRIWPQHIIGSCRTYHELTYTQTNTDLLQVLEYHHHHHEETTSHPPLSENVIAENDDDDWCLVQMHSAPWNPADTNTVQGRYPSPTHPWTFLRRSSNGNHTVVAGSEGVGQVVETRTTTTTSTSTLPRQQLNVGDFVALGLPGLGSLRSHLWVPARALLKLNWKNTHASTTNDDNDDATTYTLSQWSTLPQLGGTAFNLLHPHLLSLSLSTNKEATSSSSTTPPPVVVIQNAARSNVGFFVQQLLPLLLNENERQQQRCVLIQVVRQRSDPHHDIINYFAANDDYEPPLSFPYAQQQVTVSEEELEEAKNSHAMWRLVQDRYLEQLQGDTMSTSLLPRPTLALDAVGGASGSRLFSLLAGSAGTPSSSTLINYGALSQEPLRVPPPHLIFQNKIVRGHWHSRYMEDSPQSNKQALLDRLVRWVEKGRLQLPPVRTVPLSEYKEALEDEEENATTAATSLNAHGEHEGPRLLWPSRPKLVFRLLEDDA